MSDLVERLRTKYVYCIGPNCENWELMSEAADEIEQLNEEMYKLIKFWENEGGPPL